jgi:hypothetical protein
MLKSFASFWPAEVPLLVQLDDDLLLQDVRAILRDGDAVSVGWDKDHAEFAQRNRGRDDPSNYRRQAVRFCHKVFAIKRALEAARADRQAGGQGLRYLVWIDADVIITRPVTMDDLKKCLPDEGDAVAYLGRKDWDHSECGWLAFDLERGGTDVIEWVAGAYQSDQVFGLDQWHDSWVWDRAIKERRATNLTEGKPGMDIWPHSPMGAWSTHHKGPAAKSRLGGGQPQHQPPPMTGNNVIIKTKNALPDEEIQAHIAKNQEIIRDWISPCRPTDEALVIASAGPMLVAEDLRAEVAAGRRIVAVKHALVPLKSAGITPWACILLDPRPHVADFVRDADPAVLWFVASQVDPQVTLELLAKGCRVWGYHAAVNAGEERLTARQQGAVISGGSATATRGMFMLNQLGFSRFRLYGYDLCLPDKPDFGARDQLGQPKYLEISVGMNDPLYSLKRLFFSEPQLVAQFEEINQMLKERKFEIEAFGEGIVPFMIRSQKVADLRRAELRAKLAGESPPSYQDMLNGNAPSRPVVATPAGGDAAA